jgi:hypothetical protein
MRQVDNKRENERTADVIYLLYIYGNANMTARTRRKPLRFQRQR